MVVAFKVVQLPPQQSKLEKEQQKMAMETAISTALRHPNVVQTFSYEMVPLKSTYQGAAVRARPPNPENPTTIYAPTFLLYG